MRSTPSIEISPILLRDNTDKINELIGFIEANDLKVRKIKTEPFMMASILYEKVDGMWNIHLYNYTRHRGTAFQYIYLALASILRRERIWFKTINPISLDEINNRILTDHFSGKTQFTRQEEFRQEVLQGIYIAFEIDLLLRQKKVTGEEVIGLFHDSEYLHELAGFGSALRRNGFEIQAKEISDYFWKEKQYDFLKTIERIDECIDKNAITEKDYFYLQKTRFKALKDIDFDAKFDIFMKDHNVKFEFDLAISFAGEDREIAKEISEALKNRGYRIFYDEYEKSKMWGKDLYEYLSVIYSTKAKYCLIILSESYVKKDWTRLERKAAQSKAFQDENEYILPLRLDDAVVPGILPTTGYIDFRNEKFENIIDLLVQKINNYGD